MAILKTIIIKFLTNYHNDATNKNKNKNFQFLGS